MKIDGLRMLNANYYHQITIHGDKIVVRRYDKAGRVISKNDGFRAVSSDHPISAEIKKLDDVSAIDRVVEYYLDYNKITSISDDVFVNGISYSSIIESPCDVQGSVLDSCPSKKLRFRTELSKRTAEMIKNKYEFDRNEFLLHLVDNAREFGFYMVRDKMGYRIDKADDGRDKGIFFLAAKRDSSGRLSILPDEVEFAKKAISMIMDDSLATATVEHQLNWFNFSVPILSESGHKEITMPESLSSIVTECVSKHNQSVLDSRREDSELRGKVYQMKMEGF